MSPKMAKVPVLTVKDAAEYLKLSEMTILRLASKGIIPGWKLGRQWRFSRDVLFEHLNNSYTGQRKKK